MTRRSRLSSRPVAIKQLFHFKEGGQNYSPIFSTGVFFLPYILLATVTYGLFVTSSLFVPSLPKRRRLRAPLRGHLLHKLDHTRGAFADEGCYALMDAAVVLGGTAQMIVSLTVILLEATGTG